MAQRTPSSIPPFAQQIYQDSQLPYRLPLVVFPQLFAQRFRPPETSSLHLGWQGVDNIRLQNFGGKSDSSADGFFGQMGVVLKDLLNGLT
jgi:hypothetical protein